MVRFDLRQSFATPTSDHVGKYFEQLKKGIRRAYKDPNMEIGHLWVREKETAKGQHYHCVIWLDGDIVRTARGISHLIQKHWQDEAGIRSVAFPDGKRYHSFSKADEQAQAEAVYHASYLAKTRGKGYRADQAKDYGASRLTKHTEDKKP